MPRGYPTLRRHKPSGQGVVTLSGKDHYCGPWPRRSLRKPPPETCTHYERLVAEWLANGRQLPAPRAEAPALTVGE
jgi:hypothetical protein